MIVREQVPLSSLTTLKVGGAARFVAECETVADIEAAVAFARERAVPFVVLGSGSNVLPSDDGYAGVVIRMRIPGMSFEETPEQVFVTVGAGVLWDAFVKTIAARALWGVENLAGIPGTVGAAPVQNIGAYGAQVQTIVDSVTVYDTRLGKVRTLSNDECDFSYRDSLFKHDPSLIITSVRFRFPIVGAPHIEYADLIKAKETGSDLSTPSAIGETVRAVRSRKFPDLNQYGTAGSFFKNPIVTKQVYDELSARYRKDIEPFGSMPTYPMPGALKIPLAFILDKLLGLRGYRQGNTFLFGNQPLVLVADTGATAHEVDALASSIEQRVFDATGISIEREVRDLRFHECSE